MRFTGRRYDTDELVEIEVQQGRIHSVVPASESHGLAAHPVLAPAFVDLQVNGYGGQEFSSPKLTIDDVGRITNAMNPFGVSRYLPTVTTNSSSTIRHAMQTIATACSQDVQLGRRIPGIHLEGPFIAKDDGPRGAHPLQHCCAPDWDLFCQFQEAADGRIRLLTLSGEYAEAPEFIRKAVASGVVISIGHTAANTDQIRAAVDAGARLSTHLGNGAHRSLPRHPNYLWDQLAEDRLSASLICDGHHLPRAVVQTFMRAKSPERCILVSDLSGLAGLPPGRYTSELCDLEILEDGRLVLAGQTQLLAGASAPIAVGIAKVIDFAGVSFSQAVAMATRLPAELIGQSATFLEVGSLADFVLLDFVQATSDQSEINVRTLFASGSHVFQKASSD